MAGWTNDEGNINLDFLIGLLIFMGAFLYLITMIPGIFLPYQTNSIDLGSIVYRTSCILAEDPGWYANPVTDANGTDWENHGLADLARVGLGVDKRSPNVLAIDKINAMQGLPYILSRDDLGLNNTLVYNYSLKIQMFASDGSPGQVLLNKSYPWYSGNVESIDRMVLIREGQGLSYDSATLPSQAMSLNFGRSPCFDKVNVTVRLSNFVPTDGSSGGFGVAYYVGPYYDDTALVTAIPNQDYYVKINNALVDAGSLEMQSFNIGDTLDVIIDVREISAKYAAQGLNISRMMVLADGFSPFPAISQPPFNEEFEDYNTTNPYFRYFDTRGIMTLRVWEAMSLRRNDEGQLHTMEGVIAALILIFAILYIMGAINLVSPQTGKAVDMKHAVRAQDILTALGSVDQPSNYSSELLKMRERLDWYRGKPDVGGGCRGDLDRRAGCRDPIPRVSRCRI